jgi:hypothetical protein
MTRHWKKKHGTFLYSPNFYTRMHTRASARAHTHTYTHSGAHKAGGCGVADPADHPKPPKPTFKKHRFCRYYDIKLYAISPSAEISHWSRLMTGTLEFWKLIKLNKKKQEDKTLWLSHRTCSCIRMYINAVADSVILYLQHDFYNIIFKIKVNYV